MNQEHEILSRARGTVDRLFWLPTSGRVKGDGLTKVQLWAAAYERQGLPFGRSKDDAEALRELSAAGFFEQTGGRTKASAHRLTWAGLVATLPDGGNAARDLLVDLQTLVEMGGTVNGYELCPSAADWCKGKTPKPYAAELDKAMLALMPLQIMGWVRVQTSHDGTIWNATVTDSGRAIMQTPPDIEITPGTHFDFEAWRDGFDTTHFEVHDPPAFTRNLIPRRLSAGGAWHHIDSKTKAQRYRTLEAAQTRAKDRIEKRFSGSHGATRNTTPEIRQKEKRR